MVRGSADGTTLIGRTGIGIDLGTGGTGIARRSCVAATGRFVISIRMIAKFTNSHWLECVHHCYWMTIGHLTITITITVT